jgi:hypothetical protein
MYTEVDWDMEIEEFPATEHFEEGPSLARPFGVHTLEIMDTLSGGVGHREKVDHKGKDDEGKDHEGEGGEGEGGEGEEQGSS